MFQLFFTNYLKCKHGDSPTILPEGSVTQRRIKQIQKYRRILIMNYR